MVAPLSTSVPSQSKIARRFTAASPSAASRAPAVRRAARAAVPWPPRRPCALASATRQPARAAAISPAAASKPERRQALGEMRPAARRVTSILPPSGASIRILRACRCSLRLIPPVRNASGPPYFASPTIGWPIAAICARSWCVRPVSGCSSTQAARLPARSIIRQRVFAGSPCSSLMCIFSPPVPGCLASGASIMPSSRIGDSDDQRPIDLARRAARKRLGEMPGRPRGARDQQRARRVLVEPVDELGPAALVRPGRRAAGRGAGWSWSRPASPGPAAC